MSIATSITGGNAQSQLFDLLTVVANPALFQSKLDELNAATETYKKMIELAGPADEILSIRADIAAKQAQATQALDDATKAATAVTVKAADEAAATIADAQDQAKKLIADAKVKTATADCFMGQALAAQQKADEALAAASALQVDYEAKSAGLDARMAAATTAQAEAEAYRDSLAAKVQAFAKGL
jgi:hypothetical protein